MLGGRSDGIVIVVAVMLAVSLLTVCLRCFVRLQVVKAFGWDDGLMVIAMVFNIAFAICGILGATSGIGKEMTYFEHRPADFRRAMFCWWLGQIFYTLSTTTMRQSITTQLFRFTFERVHAIILYVVSILSFAVGMVFLFFTVFQCSPVEYYWERLTMQGHCLNTNLLTGITYFYSAVAAACDLTIGLLPAFLIRPLRASHRTKIGVAVILGIGCVFVSTTGILSSRNNFVSSASAAVIVRIPFLDSIKSDEFLHATNQVAIWSNIEAGLGITAGSLAPLRPLSRKVRTAAVSLKNQLVVFKTMSFLALPKKRQEAELDFISGPDNQAFNTPGVSTSTGARANP